MKCSISGCPSIYEKKGQSISFHGFPHNPKILTVWVAATGTPDFIPTNTSKICSKHFDESAYNRCGVYNKLKSDAIPTKLLSEIANRQVKEYLRTEVQTNATSCILDSATPLRSVAVVRDGVPPPTTIKASPPAAAAAPASTIKVVDMKKLLQPQSQPPITNTSSVLNSLVSKYICGQTATPIELLVSHTGITANKVLTCLRVILPGKFDLSRMIPNEKVASLVIRYLKLDEKNENIQKVVKQHLKLIIDSAKAKDKKILDCFGNSPQLLRHPYTKINDRDLKRALAIILPNNFSMTDITDELLRLICIILNLDINSDAHHILIKKIRKFTSEGQKFNEILNRGNNICDISQESEKDLKVKGNGRRVANNEIRRPMSSTNNINSGDSDVVFIGETRRDLEFVDVGNATDLVSLPTSQEAPLELEPTIKSSSDPPYVINFGTNLSSKDSLHSSDAGKEKLKRKKHFDKDINWEPEIGKPIKIAIPQLPPITWKLDGIIRYLEENKCSARNVLHDYERISDICRYIEMKPKSENLKRVELKLRYIIDNKLNIRNFRHHILKMKQELFPKPARQHPSSRSLHSTKKAYVDKLKMKPVVVLKDCLNYEPDQLLFMKKTKEKSNGFYKQIPFSLKLNSSDHKYSTEHVKKLTDDSYKQFRRIILKREGTKGIFRVKYAKLSPGTVVYAKNFRHPGVGWVRGVVSKPIGPLQYVVKLDNDSSWCCTVDQLRPLLNKVISNVESQRSHRPIKPKQLFDL